MDAVVLVGELNCHMAQGNTPNAKHPIGVFMSLGGDSVLASNSDRDIELIL